MLVGMAEASLRDLCRKSQLRAQIQQQLTDLITCLLIVQQHLGHLDSWTTNDGTTIT